MFIVCIFCPFSLSLTPFREKRQKNIKENINEKLKKGHETSLSKPGKGENGNWQCRDEKS